MSVAYSTEPMLLDALQAQALTRPDAEALAWCGEDGEIVERWSYARLYHEAAVVSARLASGGVQPGERVLLLAPQGLAFVAGFYGALMARVVPVTLPAPRSRRSVERVRLVAEDCAPVAMLVTTAQQAGLARALAAAPGLQALPQIVLDGAQSSPGLQPVETSLRAEAQDYSADVAFLQYTSGSTSQPKGVAITHGNLAHQCAGIRAVSGMGAATIVVSWLPLTHDMGLVGAVLAPLACGGRTVLLPPAAALQRPLLWLEAASRARATMLVGPDFGYAACATAAAREELPAVLDLATLTAVWTGAEPVRAETIKRFDAAFAPAGFRRESWLPCYGMAETTLMATGQRTGRAPTVRTFCATALAAGEAVKANGSRPHRTLTSCGVPHGGMEVAIVAPDTRAVLPADRVGEIWVRGGSVAAGYWGKPELTREVFGAELLECADLSVLCGGGNLFPAAGDLRAAARAEPTAADKSAPPQSGDQSPQSKAPWLRTGDLGFLHAGELYPCGRLKDMIKLRGRNLYPQDIESAVATALPWLAPNGCAAFVVEKDGAEAIGLLIEADRAFTRLLKKHADSDTSVVAQIEEVTGLIRQAVTEEADAAPAHIAFTGPADFPRTTSGKVQRSAAQQIATTAGDVRVLLAVRAGSSVARSVPEGPRKLAGGEARNERNHRIPPPTECAPEGAPETSHSPPPLRGDDDLSLASGGSASLHPRLISERPSGTAEVDRILAALRTFGERHLNSMLADQRRTFGPDVLMDLAELGLFGLQVPRAEGGLGLSHRQTARISIQLGAMDMSLSVMVGMHNGLGLGPILAAASAEARATLVPILASGRGLASYALTEVGVGGSNPRGLRTIARAVPGGYVLSGHKIWTGLAPWARVITVIANALDEAGQPLGTLACLVRRGNPGLRIGEELLTMGIRSIPQNHVHFEDAFIPAADVLGAPGDGMRIAQGVMQNVRLGIAAMSAGAMQRCAQLAVRYATHRTVATGPLLENPVTRGRLDWMLHAAAAAEALVVHCAEALDAGRELPDALYAVAKITAPENLATVADWTLQALGGAGYTETNEIARLVRDARVLRIFEGPTEALEHHLGAQARRETAKLGETLDAIAPGSDLSPRLYRAAASAGAGSEGRLGRCAAELLLLAVLARDEGGRMKDEESSATRAWQEERCAAAEAALAAPADLPASDDLLRRVQALSTSVGDLHRRAAGEDHQPHPFLRENPSHSQTSGGSNAPGSAPDGPNANGVASTSPGLARGTSAYPRTTEQSGPNPERVPSTDVPSPDVAGVMEPFQGSGASSDAPRVGSHSSGQPWADRGNRVAVEDASAGGDARMAALLALVTDTLLGVLRDQVDGSLAALDPDAPLTRYGMDSLATVEVAVRLEKLTGRKVPPDLLAQTQTAREVAHLLAGEPLHDPTASHGDTAPPAKSTPFPQRMAQAMERVHRLRAADRYPYHPVTTAVEPGRVTIHGKRMVMLGSFEYLGLGDDPRILEAHVAALRRFGSGSRGAQAGTGRTVLHEAFEARVAAMFGAESAILFSTGYLACLAPIGAVVGAGDFVVGDALNHACIVDGCRLAGARFQSYAHNDVAALERQLADVSAAHALVIAEGIYSMDGDIGRIPEIAEVCQRHGAMLMVDEAHSLGVLGRTGRGVSERFGLGADAITIKVGTLSKSFGGIGGFAVGRRDLMDYLRHHARGYVFCAALPAPNVAASLAALEVLEQEPWRVERLQANARRWRDGLRTQGYDIFTSETPIVPVRMPDEPTAFEFTHRCKERGVFVVPVVFPAVPQNAPRLRTCMTAGLSDDDISQALEVFATVGREMGVIGCSA